MDSEVTNVGHIPIDKSKIQPVSAGVMFGCVEVFAALYLPQGDILAHDGGVVLCGLAFRGAS